MTDEAVVTRERLSWASMIESLPVEAPPSPLIDPVPTETLEDETPSPSAIPPFIKTGPSSQSVERGGSATFSVVVEGTEPFHYQWFFNDEAIPGGNASSFTLDQVPLIRAGSYSVRVNNRVGSATSDVALLEVWWPR